MNKLLSSRKQLLLLAIVNALLATSLYSGLATAVTTLTFSDNTSPLSAFPNPGGTVGKNGFSQIPVGDLFTPGEFPEFRVTSAFDTVSLGGEKTVIPSSGPAVEWVFGDDINFTAVNNSETTPGVDLLAPNLHNTGQITAMMVANVGDVGLFHNTEALFPGGFLGFLAPTVGSAAAIFYGGNGIISVDFENKVFTVILPVVELQWSGFPLPLGRDDDLVNGDKITFHGTMSNVQLNTPSAGLATFDYRMTANHVITHFNSDNGWLGEDSCCLSLQTSQWELVGSGVAPNVAASPPAAATGTLTATTAGSVRNDGRVTVTELNGAPYNIPVDTLAEQTCIGGCFAFTVSGIAGATETVTFPLSASIPANAIYRKYINGVWVNFDTSGADMIESGPGVQGICAPGVVFTPGMTEGHFCIRLTIADGGPNDSDGIVNSNIVDPGGVGVISPVLVDTSSSGCRASATTVSATHRADWFVLAAFIGLLSLRRFRRNTD